MTSATHLAMPGSLDNIAFHPEFCFEDGSIILLVEHTEAFKVHKGLLRQHSTVFEDMLSLPLDGNDAAFLQNVPVVRLPQDSTAGFAGVLKAIYDNRLFGKHLPNILRDQGEQQYLEFLSAMMTVARRYDFESVSDGCVDALGRLLPTQLQDMAPRIELLRFAADESWRTAIIVTTLDLVNTFDLYQFFPSLFYEIIAFHTPDEIYDLKGLSWKDKTRCVTAIAELRVEQSQELRCRLPLVGECTKLVRTDEGWVRPMCNQRPLVASELRSTKRIVVFDKLEFEEESSVVHCRDCTLRYTAEYEKNQLRLWNALPKIFHLAKSWEDLLQGRME